jgi:hypothetical protein
MLDEQEKRAELLSLQSELDRLGAKIALAEAEVRSLEEAYDSQLSAAGAAKLTDVGSRSVFTLGEIADYTRRDLRRALEYLTALLAERARLQLRRRELLAPVRWLKAAGAAK